MDKFLGGLIKIEKSLQVMAVVSVVVLLGYLSVEQYRGDRASAPTRSSLQPMMSTAHPD